MAAAIPSTTSTSIRAVAATHSSITMPEVSNQGRPFAWRSAWRNPRRPLTATGGNASSGQGAHSRAQKSIDAANRRATLASRASRIDGWGIPSCSSTRAANSGWCPIQTAEGGFNTSLRAASSGRSRSNSCSGLPLGSLTRESSSRSGESGRHSGRSPGARDNRPHTADGKSRDQCRPRFAPADDAEHWMHAACHEHQAGSTLSRSRLAQCRHWGFDPGGRRQREQIKSARSSLVGATSGSEARVAAGRWVESCALSGMAEVAHPRERQVALDGSIARIRATGTALTLPPCLISRQLAKSPVLDYTGVSTYPIARWSTMTRSWWQHPNARRSMGQPKQSDASEI